MKPYKLYSLSSAQPFSISRIKVNWAEGLSKLAWPPHPVDQVPGLDIIELSLKKACVGDDHSTYPPI